MGLLLKRRRRPPNNTSYSPDEHRDYSCNSEEDGSPQGSRFLSLPSPPPNSRNESGITSQRSRVNLGNCAAYPSVAAGWCTRQRVGGADIILVLAYVSKRTTTHRGQDQSL